MLYAWNPTSAVLLEVVLLFLSLAVCRSTASLSSASSVSKAAKQLPKGRHSVDADERKPAESSSSFAVKPLHIPATSLVILGSVNENLVNKIGSNWYGFNKYITRPQRSQPVDTTLRSPQEYRDESNVYPGNHVNRQWQNGPRNYAVQQNRQHPEPARGMRLVKEHRQRPMAHSNSIENSGHRGRGGNEEYDHPQVHREGDARGSQRKPLPVMIKIIPLKLTSQYVTEALKTMSVVPLPLSIIDKQGHHNGHENSPAEDRPRNGRYAGVGPAQHRHDRYARHGRERTRESEDQYGYPPPSSHVATPPDSPLGVIYDDEDDREYFRRYPRRG